MRNLTARFSPATWFLVAIVALGLALRLWGINFGLPYMYQPDEGVPVSVALRILHTGDFNPGFFHWSSLLFYLNAALYFAFYVVGRLGGSFASLGDLPLPDVEAIAVGKTALPELFLISRGFSAIVGALSIVIVFLIVRRIVSDRRAAWLAALLLAVEWIDVKNSQYIRPDTFVVFFELLTVFFALRIMDDPRLRNYLLAGISAGLATSFKYNAALIFLAILVAHVFSSGTRRVFRKEIFLAAACSALAFLLTTPYAVLDLPQFLAIGPLQAASIYATGHSGAEGDTLSWYIQFFLQTQGWILLPALGEVIAILFWRERKGLILVVFPAVYYVLINLFTVHFDETALPIIPFLLILAALFLARLDVFISSRRIFPRALINVAWVGVAIAAALPPLGATAQSNVQLLQRDARDQAREWIDANLPSGSRIALEAYAPYVDPARFTVEGVDFTVLPPEWFEQNGFEYLVFSNGSFGRFYENPTQYRDIVNRYDALFSRFQPVARFDENGYEVRIYKTNTEMLPAHRVAARFGIYAPMLELVGYDQMGGYTGEANLTLYWRALATRRERLLLTARLLDRNDQEIARTGGDLFGGTAKTGGQWPDGIVRVPLRISLPAAAAGLYRVELDVDAEDLGRIPVLSRDNKPVSDKLFLGPFKVPPLPPAANELQSAHVSAAQFGNVFVLQSYRADESARAGESASITLYWKSIGKTDLDYTVFVHLLDSAGNIRAQVDAPPRGGAYPTSIWDVGELIRDDYALLLPRDLKPGDYQIETGAYAFPSLTRLPISNANGKPLGDHLILDTTVKIQ
jgi:4-amino-4-deoxy-L-arabinose transferase-like glycosyltransferase